jgi:hypothetical protein
LSKRIALLTSIGLLIVGPDPGPAATFGDPQGDATGGAGDITQMVVSNDAGGNITFALTIPNRAALETDDRLFVLLDSDKDTTTGATSLGGVDYVLVITGAAATLQRASGPFSFAPAPHATMRLAEGGKTVTLNRSDLGETKGFFVIAESRLVSTPGVGDDAPDRGFSDYDLELEPRLGTLSATFAPVRPEAGKPLRLARITLRLDDGTVVRADSVTCLAKLNGRRLTGRCFWRIPKSARGKRLVVTLTARYQGAASTFASWRFRVG